MKFSLPAYALRRPVTVMMIIATILGLGCVAWYKMPIEFIPKMETPLIVCFIPYPEATPEQVEKEVAIPAEGEFKTIAHLEGIRTVSNSDGCQVEMLFDLDADMALASAEVRDRMERLKLKLPPTVDRLYLQRFSADTMPIMVIGFFREGDEEELAYLTRTVIQPRLLRQEGVADAKALTRPERDVLIEFDQNALRNHHLGLYQVVSLLQGSSVNVSVGELIEGNTKFYVRAMGEFSRPEQLADIPLGAEGLRLKDVAKVGYRMRNQDFNFAMGNKSGAFILISKESQANTIAVSKAVEAELERLKTDPLFQDVEQYVLMDQSKMILGALNGLIEAGEYGAGLSCLVLFFFLLRLRPTLVVTLAIPASVVTAICYLYFAGMTLNVITMAGLIVAVGMLVDNAIVVMENIYRYHQLGVDQMESARRGASEVGMAITASTLTTMVVFVPVLYLDAGRMSIYMWQFAAPVIVSLAASLGIALTAIPLASTWMRSARPVSFLLYETGAAPPNIEQTQKPKRWFAVHPFAWLIHLYKHTLQVAMRQRLATFMVLIIVLLVTYLLPMRHIGMGAMPALDLRRVSIQVKFDPNFDMTMADESFRQIQEAIDAQRQELGIKNIFLQYQPSGGNIDVILLKEEDLKPGEKIPFTTEEVLDILWQRLPTRLPGVELDFPISEENQDTSTKAIFVHMRGDDARLLKEYAERFCALLGQIPHVVEAEVQAERAKEEMQISVDQALAEHSGVSPRMLAQTVDFALRGIQLPYLKQGGREIPVWAQFREEDRTTRANLDNVAMLGAHGRLVSVNELVTLNKAKSPQAIARENGKNVVVIGAKFLGKDMRQVSEGLRKLIATFDLPQGYRIDLGEELLEMAKEMSNFITSLLFAVLLVYLVMGALFESWLAPFSILSTVLLAFIGVYWTLYLFKVPMDTVAFIGCILMVGVIVNNGIVIVDHINFLRSQGKSRYDAIIQAGMDRLRPVLMTALTTILGCVPIAIGSGRGGGSGSLFRGLGLALIGGLTTGTFLTLFVVPLFYSFIDDFRGWFERFCVTLSAVAGTGKSSAPSPEK